MDRMAGKSGKENDLRKKEVTKNCLFIIERREG
jgi:hypothetical protein